MPTPHQRSVHPHTHARELALQYLYMHDLLAGQGVQSFADYLAAQDEPIAEEAAGFAAKLVDAVLAHRDELDKEIGDVAVNWRVARMSTVDRNVLRLGLAELVTAPDTPYRVILDEAVELARRFSSETSCAFVNGVLDRLRILHQGGGETPDAAPADATPDAPANAPETAPEVGSADAPRGAAPVEPAGVPPAPAADAPEAAPPAAPGDETPSAAGEPLA